MLVFLPTVRALTKPKNLDLLFHVFVCKNTNKGLRTNQLKKIKKNTILSPGKTIFTS